MNNCAFMLQFCVEPCAFTYNFNMDIVLAGQKRYTSYGFIRLYCIAIWMEQRHMKYGCFACMTKVLALPQLCKLHFTSTYNCDMSVVWREGHLVSCYSCRLRRCINVSVVSSSLRIDIVQQPADPSCRRKGACLLPLCVVPLDACYGVRGALSCFDVLQKDIPCSQERLLLHGTVVCTAAVRMFKLIMEHCGFTYYRNMHYILADKEMHVWSRGAAT